jgi:hypothetical protein
MILDMMSQGYRSTKDLWRSDASLPPAHLPVSPDLIVLYDNTARIAERLS